MKIFLLPENGNFYKTNLHCHTNISDGKQTPIEVKEFYKSMGYSAVCYTDHEVLIAHNELCDKDFIALHGYEVAVKQDIHGHTGFFMPVYHFNMIAEKQDNLIMPRCFVKNPSMAGNSGKWFNEFRPYDENDTIEATEYNKEWLNTYLSAVKDAGFLITYNHPAWSIQSYNDFVGLQGLFAIEVINGSCVDLGDCTSLRFEEMLRAGMKVLPIGGDDNHHKGDCGIAWTMIKAPELTYDALITACKNGDCYASCGPEIKELYIENGQVCVKTSPAARIILRGEGRCTMSAHDTDNARFDYLPNAFGKYFRIEVKDSKGNFAYSRAYMTKDINIE